jgi:hypothetical protein
MIDIHIGRKLYPIREMPPRILTAREEMILMEVKAARDLHDN